MPSFDAIALDVDGTLLDSTEMSVQILYQTLRAAGMDITMADLHFAHHATDVQVWNHFGLGHRERELLAIMQRVEKPLLNTQHPFPGAVELLHSLRAEGLTLALVSNRTDAQFTDDPVLSALIPLADFWISCETVGVGKPDPAPLLHFLEKAQCTPERALLLGDSPSDGDAAHAAGMPFALALWGALDADIPADYRLEKPEDLLALLRSS